MSVSAQHAWRAVLAGILTTDAGILHADLRPGRRPHPGALPGGARLRGDARDAAAGGGGYQHGAPKGHGACDALARDGEESRGTEANGLPGVASLPCSEFRFARQVFGPSPYVAIAFGFHKQARAFPSLHTVFGAPRATFFTPQAGLTPAELAVRCNALLTTAAGRAWLDGAQVLVNAGRNCWVSGNMVWAAYAPLRTLVAAHWPAGEGREALQGVDVAVEGIPEHVMRSGIGEWARRCRDAVLYLGPSSSAPGTRNAVGSALPDSVLCRLSTALDGVEDT